MKKLITISILFILISFSVSAKGEPDVGWPKWRGPTGDGISTETDWNPEVLADGPEILWELDIGTGYSNVAILNNRLYTLGYISKEKVGYVYCLAADSGKEIWRQPYLGEKPGAPQPSPVIDGDYLYVLSSEGILMCLAARNGKVQWSKDIISEFGVVKPFFAFGGSPVVAGELIILTANSSGLALDKKTGSVVWESAKPPSIGDLVVLNVGFTSGVSYSTPVLYHREGKQYAIISGWKGLHSVDVETGEVHWLYEWELYSGGQIADPLIFDDKVFIVPGGRPDGVLLDIAGDDPSVLWMNRELKSECASPVLIDGYFYVYDGKPGAGRDNLKCINAQTGQIMWETRIFKEIWQYPKDFDVKVVDPKMEVPSFTAAHGYLIILEGNGTLRIAEATPTTYKEISSAAIIKGYGHQFWTHPVLYNGKIYCRDFRGPLICVDVSN